MCLLNEVSGTSAYLTPLTTEQLPTENSSSLQPFQGSSSHLPKTSAAQNAFMHDLIRPFAGTWPTPAGCRLVSFSSWTRFSSSTENKKTSDEMKASVLWAAAGKQPDFDPPILEWTNYGVDQSIKPGNPLEVNQSSQRHWHVRKQDSNNSTPTAQAVSEPITFAKQSVRWTSTCSLLSATIKTLPVQGLVREKKPLITLEMAREFGINQLSSSLLSDPFQDSSDEDE
jgi:hypothetical protein